MTHREQGNSSVPEVVWPLERAEQTETGNQADVFAVEQGRTVELVPSISAAASVLEVYYEGYGPPGADEDDFTANTPSRGVLRDASGILGPHLRRSIRAGAQLIASYDDIETGMVEGKQMVDAVFPEVMREVSDGLWNSRIVRAARPTADMYRVAQQVTGELAGAAEAGPEVQYELLKLFASQPQAAGVEVPATGAASWLPSQLLNLHAKLGGSDVPTVLTRELERGAYDRLVALDVLAYTQDNPTAEGTLARVRQLSTFLSAFMGSRPEDMAAFHRTIAGVLAEWPLSEQEAVRDARFMLRDRVQANAGKGAGWLQEQMFSGAGDKTAAFEAGLQGLQREVLKRLPVTPETKAEIMRLRMQARQRKATPVGISSAKRRNGEGNGNSPKAEHPQRTDTEKPVAEPRKLIVCDLSDSSRSEDTDFVVDMFMEEVGQEGDTELRDDIGRMLTHMARTDLPPNFRRGIKSIQATAVRFDDKLWDLYELKPTDAAGLSTRTAIAKDSRVYFIKLPENVLGLVGIVPRAKQDDFLKSVRVKSKQRG